MLIFFKFLKSDILSRKWWILWSERSLLVEKNRSSLNNCLGHVKLVCVFYMHNTFINMALYQLTFIKQNKSESYFYSCTSTCIRHIA